MNIQNIQIAQGLSRIVEERLNSRKENISSQNGASLPQGNSPDATVDDLKASSEKDLMKVVYPPFFPIGNTQDILFIEGVKQTIGEKEKNESPVSLDEQKAIRQQESNKAASPDAGVVEAKAPQVKHEDNPGVVLDFKI